MNGNSGSTLKVIAVIMGILGVIGAIIIAVSIGIALDDGATGFGTFIGVAFASVLSALMLYGFGELIENTARISDKAAAAEKQLDQIKRQLASQPLYDVDFVTSEPTETPAAGDTNAQMWGRIKAMDLDGMPVSFMKLATTNEVYKHFCEIHENNQNDDTRAMEKILADLCQLEASGKGNKIEASHIYLRRYYKHGKRVFAVDRSGKKFKCPVCNKELFSDRAVCHECGALFRD